MNIKGFFRLILSFYVRVARHVQITHITQNIKFAISLQYLTKKMSYEVYILHTVEHEGFLQIKSMVLIEMVKHYQSSQNSKFAMSLHISNKKLEIKLIFCMQLNIKVYFNTLGIKFSTRWYYQYWRTWSSILKVLKVTSL